VRAATSVRIRFQPRHSDKTRLAYSVPFSRRVWHHVLMCAILLRQNITQYIYKYTRIIMILYAHITLYTRFVLLYALYISIRRQNTKRTNTWIDFARRRRRCKRNRYRCIILLLSLMLYDVLFILGPKEEGGREFTIYYTCRFFKRHWRRRR